MKKKRKIKLKFGPGCPCGNRNQPIKGLGSYFDVLSSSLKKDETFWFRGNANLTWKLTPSALRHRTPPERKKALDLLSDFKRFSEMKIPNIPAKADEFKWVQLAQHYGLPTRLLDWTRNAAIALYFACQQYIDGGGNEKDGAVFLLNPINLNRASFPKDARIFEPHKDSELIEKYLDLDGEQIPKGLKAIAINPIWNSERIMLQQGVFTLHGSRYFTLTNKHESSLVYLKIEREVKMELLDELERIGVNEMSIFPEAEHMCHYLKWRDKLL